MKVNYEYTKKDYSRYLIKSRLSTNIIILVIATTIYLYFSYNKISLWFLPLFILGMLIVIFLLNKLYVLLNLKLNEMLNNNVYGKYILELTPNKFSITINKSKTDYKYKTIKKLVEKKKYFTLNFNKKRESLIFEKRLFNETDYKKIIEMFNEKISYFAKK